MKKIILSLTAMFTFSLFANAQTGEVKGKIHDEKTKEMLYGAYVFVKDGSRVINTITDKDGNFTLKPLEPGTYNVQVCYMGYDTLVMEKVSVTANKYTFLNELALSEHIATMTGTIIYVFKDPLIDVENLKVITSKQIGKLANNKDISSIITSQISDVQKSETGQLSFRGARMGDVAYYVDGMRVADANVPCGSIKSMTIFNGGIPANYGDVSGGCVVIETMNYFDWYNSQNN